MIELAWPLALLLLPLPFLARLLPARRISGQAMSLPGGVSTSADPTPGPRRRQELVLLAGIWLCLCLALAQPQRMVLVPDRSASGRNIVFALDMSGSMATQDFFLGGETLSRLDAVKQVADGFIRARSGDRIGLVIFADRAYVAAPLTHDLPAVALALDEAEIGLTGRATNISDGLGLALRRLTDQPEKSNVIVLLSDGRDTSARLDAAEVAKLAANHNVRVHTIALGPEDLASQPSARDAVDLPTLRAIAEASGGQTFRVRSMDDLREMAADLDRLEPNPSTRPPVTEPRPLWLWPALLALILAAVQGLAVRQ